MVLLYQIEKIMAINKEHKNVEDNKPVSQTRRTIEVQNIDRQT
jgi:hypothetical protein